MKFKQYIKGSRKGKEAHRIELEAMKDPFLADALDGYELMDKDHNTEKRIEQMRGVIKGRTRKRYSLSATISIAASLILCVGLGGYLLLYENPNLTQNELSHAIDISIVEEENLAPAALDEYAPEPSGPLPIRASHQLVIPEPVPYIDIPVSGEPKPLPNAKVFKEYVNESLSIPAFDECGKVRGQVVVAFKVNAKGRPYDLDIKKSLCSTADQEALRVIKEGPNWTIGDKEINLAIKF